MDGWNTTFLLGRSIFMGHVSFREGNSTNTNLAAGTHADDLCFFSKQEETTQDFFMCQLSWLEDLPAKGALWLGMPWNDCLTSWKKKAVLQMTAIEMSNISKNFWVWDLFPILNGPIPYSKYIFQDKDLICIPKKASAWNSANPDKPPAPRDQTAQNSCVF